MPKTKKHLAFTPKQLMEIINSGKLKTGDIIIFEEAGVGMSSKKQLRSAHFLTHTKHFQKRMGISKARSEHNKFAKMMLKRGMNHRSPFRSLL